MLGVPKYTVNKDLVQKFYQGLTMASRTIIDASAGGSIIELTLTQAFTLFKKVVDNDTWASSRRLNPDAYFRFNPRGTSKESCKWRRKTYLKQDRFAYAEVGEDGDRKEEDPDL
jgi:hypothetical protein